MYNLVSADLFKIRKSIAIKAAFAITSISAVFMSVIAYKIANGSFQENMSGIGFLFGDTDIMSIFGGVLAGVYICSDFDNNIIHDAIAGGFSRIRIVTGKAVSFFCAAIFILIPYAVVTSIALGTGSKFSIGSMSMGFLNLLTSEAGSTLTAAGTGKMLIVVLTLIIVCAAQLSPCVFLAFVIKKPVIVVAVYYGFSIFFGQLAILAKGSKVFYDILSCTPFGGQYALLTLSSGAGDIIKAAAVSLVFIIAILLLTHLVFRKMEIK
ncbi:MAG: ABC transporter permease [Bacillota bacterium]|nr:ABC transporter permease [Bacillota bacterium]